MIVDIHTHFYPDRLATQVLRKLSRQSGFSFYTDGTRDDTKRCLLSWGVERAVLLPVATSSHCSGSNDFSLQPDEMIIPFAAIHPDSPQPEQMLAELQERGAKGVKLHPQYQGADIDDPRYVRIIRTCAKLGLPVLFHAGFDPGLPPPWRAQPDSILRLLDRVEGLPGLTLIAAHLGSLDLFDQVEEQLAGADIYLDTALLHGRISQEQLSRIIKAHGWQRILLGSDCPWQTTADAIGDIKALKLPPQQEAGILGDNAARILGLQ